MRTSLALVLVLASSAVAQEAPPETSVCYLADCRGMNAALRSALAAAGLTEVDGLRVEVGTDGQTWLTVLSTDEVALAAVAPRSGTRAVPVRGTDAWIRAVPIALSGIDTVALPPLKGIEPDELGGVGEYDLECGEVCVCTESGVECWHECW